MYGAALHRAVADYYGRRLAGQRVTLADIRETFRAAWVAEGFLSAEHAAGRLEQGLKTLEAFYARAESDASLPKFVGRPFRFLVGADRVTGRWDAVEAEEGEPAAIVDWKTSDVWEQRIADTRARESLQLDVYALAFRRAYGRLPKRVALHFLESGVSGSAIKTDGDLSKTAERIALAGRGIRRRDYTPKPSVANCSNCAFADICPAAVRG